MKTRTLAGHSILVSGGSRGIGLAIAPRASLAARA
jgi:NAD(P)-dependent dehydrogenase (short-subunit alcohol dehydrogenase family)